MFFYDGCDFWGQKSWTYIEQFYGPNGAWDYDPEAEEEAVEESPKSPGKKEGRHRARPPPTSSSDSSSSSSSDSEHDGIHKNSMHVEGEHKMDDSSNKNSPLFGRDSESLSKANLTELQKRRQEWDDPNRPGFTNGKLNLSVGIEVKKRRGASSSNNTGNPASSSSTSNNPPHFDITNVNEYSDNFNRALGPQIDGEAYEHDADTTRPGYRERPFPGIISYGGGLKNFDERDGNVDNFDDQDMFDRSRFSGSNFDFMPRLRDGEHQAGSRPITEKKKKDKKDSHKKDKKDDKKDKKDKKDDKKRRDSDKGV